MFKDNPVKNMLIFHPPIFLFIINKILCQAMRFFWNPTILTIAKLYVTIIVHIDLTTLKF